MDRRPAACVLALAAAALTAAVSFASPPPPQADDPPPVVETPIVEEVETHLVQLDVTVLGPPEAVRGLTRHDFRLKVHTEWIESFTVDDLCRAGPTEAGAPEEGGPAAREGAAGTIPRRPLHLLLYFDQAHLTPPGRMRALRMARELARRFTAEGARLTLVSANRGLKVYAEDSDSVEDVLEALSSLDKDATQWSTEVASEDDTIREVERLAAGGSLNRVMNLVRRAREEELSRTERALGLFSSYLTRFGGSHPPRAVIYFGDRLRRTAGEHYLEYLTTSPRARALLARDSFSPDYILTTQRRDIFFGATLTFDRVVREAAAHQIRIYTVKPEGMGESRLHIREAEDTLAGLALETGGDSFLHGEGPEKIAGKLLEDYRCVYLLSFDPRDLPQDTPLSVRVELTRPGLQAQARGTLVVQSPSARRVSRLLAAFLRPGSNHAGTFAPHVDVVPLGQDGRKFVALVQVWAPGLATPKATWDLGASAVASERVQDFARRLEVQGARVPVALQRTLRFRPGPFRVVAVAQEVGTGLVGSSELTDAWPRLGDAGVTAGPVAVLQKTTAVIERDGTLLRHGWLALGEDPPARADRDLRFLCLVCRGTEGPKAVEARRRLVGATQAPFTPLKPDLAPRNCVLLRDTAPVGSLDAGRFTYEVQILDDQGRSLARAERTFVVAPAPASP